uniref:Uncharacterized protein n=1 Tax=Kwoniella bestiolae CBS 10118 TaxID=1296100 RepID=A0A1B9FVT0_9TREE|nr:hypothetical protein I302_07229 [Kwoniella bestiolae CBS 10118]OCF22882.1 hypothetical protein I302_07229 [Kwoniella bestiolae CBS 10118]
MTFLLTHPHSISLTALSKPLPSSITSTPLSLPSRFPSSSTPQVSISASGHIYLYCHSSHVIWEYDNKGKRISEISLPNEKISRVLALGDKSVMVHLKGRDELRVMEKGVRWGCINTSQAPTGKLTVLVGNATSTLVAAGSDQGELVVFDQLKGERMPISPLLTFSPSHPSTLLLPTSTSLLRVNLPSSKAAIDIKELPIKGDILDITFSPVIESSDGSKKGGLCAVLKSGGEVALIGVDSDSAPKMVSYGEELDSLVFVDGATLAGKTRTAGSLLVKDLRSLPKAPVDITCPEAITSIKVLPNMVSCLDSFGVSSLSDNILCQPRSSRSSLAPSSTSSHRITSRTPLGEREVGNTPTPPAVPPLSKGKALVREVASTGTVKEQERKVRIASEMDKGKERSTSTLRSTSGPVLPNPAVRRIRSDSKLRSNTPTILEEVEEVEREAGRRESAGSSSNLSDKAGSHSSSKVQEEEYREPSVQLDWAFQPPISRSNADSKEEKVMSESEMIEELRRELGNLQMDMLRMGRGLRNEIRQATRPLIRELEENKEVMERQRREIDRLRRGY